MRSATHSNLEHERNLAQPADAPIAGRNGPDRDADMHEVPRSDYGSVPGAELPTFVYISVLVAFAWIMLASWLAFAGDMDATLALGVAVVLAVVFFALPIIMRQVAAANSPATRDAPRDFLSSRVETATGPLQGSSAWLQVLLIPWALALAATLIGVAFVLAH
jgi:hypothetical protein